MRKLAAVLLAASLSIALAACEPTTSMVMGANPNPPAPPPRDEVVPKPPVSEDLLVWRPGEWEWADNGYVWQAGEYVKLSGHSNQFLPGHWTASNGAWLWERGHWL